MNTLLQDLFWSIVPLDNNQAETRSMPGLIAWSILVTKTFAYLLPSEIPFHILATFKNNFISMFCPGLKLHLEAWSHGLDRQAH